MPVCATCESNEFDVVQGSYFCKNCFTKCEDFVDEVAYENLADSLFTGSMSTKSEIRMFTSKRKTEIDYGRNWTSYEAYNSILRHQVDALIALGVSDLIKPIVLHLWTTYLENLGVAKMNEDTSGAKLKCNTIIRPSDRSYFLCRTDEQREESRLKIKRAKSLGEINRARRLTRKRLKMFGFLPSSNKQTSKQTASDIADDSDTLSRTTIGASEFGYLSDSLADSSQGKSIQTDTDGTVRRRSSSKRRLRLGSVLSDDGFKLMNASYSSIVKNVRYMRLTRTLSFLYLGLLLLRSDVLLSDLIRFTWNGQIPFRDAARTCLPSDMKFQMSDNALFRVKAKWFHGEIRSWTSKLANYLRITKLPDRSLHEIVDRLLVDFDLPDCLRTHVRNLINMYPTRTSCNIGNASNISIPNYEGRAAAYIILALKILFGLDGETEWQLSEYCRELECERLTHLFGVDPPFVWSEWMELTMARQSLVNGAVRRSLRRDAASTSATYSLFSDSRVGDYYRGEGSNWEVKQSHSYEELSTKETPETIIFPFMSLPVDQRPSTVCPKLVAPATSFPFISEFRESAKRLPSGSDVLRKQIMGAKFRSASVTYIVDSMGYSREESIVGESENDRLSKLRDKYADCLDLTRFYEPVRISRELHARDNRKKLEQRMPHSLYWLVCLFAGFLEMTPGEMYVEIVIVEKKIHQFRME